MNTSENQGRIFPKCKNVSPYYFTGHTEIKNLVPANDTFNTLISNVVFEPEARTNWHTHPGEQIIIATDDLGYFPENGKPIQILHTEDVMQIPLDVVHGHGASADCGFTSIAINTNIHKGSAVWLKRDTDEQYNKKTKGIKS